MLIAMAVLALTGSSGSADRSFGSAAELQRWLTYYHRQPRPELVVAALVALETELPRHGSTLEAQAARGGMRSFFGLVLAKSPAAVREVQQHDFAPGTRRFLAEALRRCGTTPCAAALADLRVEPAAALAPAPDVRRAPVDTAAAVDDLWASYSATGETVYVERVIDALPASADAADAPRGSAAGAAVWSLVSNAAHDADVLTVCVAAAERADPARRAVLDDVVRRARQARGQGPAF
jgi:hypothetical protein